MRAVAMLKCNDCKIVLDDSAHFCPKCGKQLVANQSIVSNTHGQIHKPAANLMKYLPFMVAGLAVLLIVLVVVLVSHRSKGTRVTVTPSSRSTHYSVNQPITEPGMTSSRDSRPSTSTRLDGTSSSGGGSTNRTAAEQSITNAVSESQGVSGSGVTVDDAIADPRQGIVTVTFSIPLASANKSAIIATATAVAKATFGANSEVKFVTTRCVVTGSGSQSTQIAFVGDTDRATMTALSQNSTQEQLMQAFSAQWWNPQISR
ncbi:MAG: hypothetical protein ABFD54_01055 [Armatimonadota bacterium]|nr:NOB1 family endonuclease [bacterium]